MTGDELLKKVTEEADEGLRAVDNAHDQIDALRVAHVSHPNPCPSHTIIEGCILSNATGIKAALKCHKATADYFGNGGHRGTIKQSLHEYWGDPEGGKVVMKEVLREMGIQGREGGHVMGRAIPFSFLGIRARLTITELAILCTVLLVLGMLLRSFWGQSIDPESIREGIERYAKDVPAGVTNAIFRTAHRRISQ